jgi:hypothetical protein
MKAVGRQGRRKGAKWTYIYIYTVFFMKEPYLLISDIVLIILKGVADRTVIGRQMENVCKRVEHMLSVMEAFNNFRRTSS